MTDTERLAWDLYEGRLDSSFLREPLPVVGDKAENRFAELVNVILKAEMVKWGEQFAHLGQPATARRQDEREEAKTCEAQRFPTPEPKRVEKYRTVAAQLADEIEARYR